jgi:glycerophosphoryl diester phosphodiesterase
MGAGVRVLRAGAALAAVLLLLVGCNAQTPAAPEASAPAASAPAQTLAPTQVSAFFDCLQRESATIVAAHRGGDAPGYAENAIATFEHTLSQAPVALEVDVRRTRDGGLVLMHDEDVDRTTTGTGMVYSLSTAEITALQLRDPNGQVLDGHPPTLRQALDWAAGKTILELDVKRGVPITDVVRVVREANAQQRVLIITYTAADAISAFRADPSLMISASIDSAADLDQLKRAGVDVTRVLAWTGTREPDSALNVALAEQSVESLFGTLGDDPTSWDNKFSREGDAGYAAFAETGLELIASDRAVAAQRALDAADGDGWAPARCLTAGSTP